MKGARVIKEYQSKYPETMVFKKGEYVQRDVKESMWKGWVWCYNNEKIYRWVPKHYLKSTQDKQNGHVLLKEYNAKELSVIKGDKLMLLYEESDWAWARNQKGEQGWIPLENIQIE